MRLTRLLGRTLRQPPSDAHLPSHQLLVRAGYVREQDIGSFSYLPLGIGALRRLQALVQRAFVPLHGQQIKLAYADPDGAPDHRVDKVRSLVQLARREVDSYRQLPVIVYEMVSRPAPASEARAGLFTAGERHVAEITAFGDSKLRGDDPQITGALGQVFERCGVPITWAEADEGDRQAFYAHPSGDAEAAQCPECGYAAERSRASTAWPEPPDEPEEEPEEISTPDCDTIATLADFLDLPASKTLKMVFYSVEGKVTCIVIRGDRKVDETKLARVLGTTWYYASIETELADVGAVGGYASPIGLDHNLVRVVADPSVRSGRNFVSGANRPDYHIRNVNVPRDFSPGEWANLALIEAGDPCPMCGGDLQIVPGFSLASSTAAEPCEPPAEYLDQAGKARPLWTAGWSLDLSRLMAAAVERHHDDYGITWPVGCAPYDVHIVALDLRKEGVAEQADDLYERLQASGYTVLFDDRDASAGVKFNDADLIGVPLRLTLGKRSVKEGLIEAKWRHDPERLRLDAEGLAAELARAKM